MRASVGELVGLVERAALHRHIDWSDDFPASRSAPVVLRSLGHAAFRPLRGTHGVHGPWSDEVMGVLCEAANDIVTQTNWFLSQGKACVPEALL